MESNTVKVENNEEIVSESREGHIENRSVQKNNNVENDKEIVSESREGHVENRSVQENNTINVENNEEIVSESREGHTKNNNSMAVVDILYWYFYSIIGERNLTQDAIKELSNLTGWEEEQIQRWFKQKYLMFSRYNITPYYAQEAIKYRPMAKKFQESLKPNSALRVTHMPSIFETIDRIAMPHQILPDLLPLNTIHILNCYFYSILNTHFPTMKATEELADITGLNRSQVLVWLNQKEAYFKKRPVPKQFVFEAQHYQKYAEDFQASLPSDSHLRVPFVPSPFTEEEENYGLATFDESDLSMFKFYYYSILEKDPDTRNYAIKEFAYYYNIPKTLVDDWVIQESYNCETIPYYFLSEYGQYMSNKEFYKNYLPVNSVLRPNSMTFAFRPATMPYFLIPAPSTNVHNNIY